MGFLIYEPDAVRRKKLRAILQEIYKDVSVYDIQNQEEGLQRMKEEHIHAAFMNWQESSGKGFFISRNLKLENERLNVVALCEDYKYLSEFWKYHMSGYVLGEPTREKVEEELDNLRYR